MRHRPNLSKPSIWDLDVVAKALDREDVKATYATTIQNYLLRHPEIRRWSEVEWPKKVPEHVRRFFSETFVVRTTRVHERSEGGETVKLAMKLADDLLIECVIIKHKTLRSQRVTVCVSSQVGCQMGCKFCATGTMGLLGDLTQAEIIEQVLEAKNEERISNVVFMGMGEPLNNYDNVLGACRCLLDDKLFALGKVTVSTVGITARIRQLAVDEPRANLALSLHAPTQEKRQMIMPSAKAHRLDVLVDSLNFYVETRGSSAMKKKLNNKRRDQPLVMIEYILLGGINDSDDDARALGALVSDAAFGSRAMINLIAYNPVPGLDFQRPVDDDVRRFQAILQTFNILTCVRITMGNDVNGACGQLVKQLAPNHVRESLPDIEDVPLPPLASDDPSTNNNRGSGGDHKLRHSKEPPSGTTTLDTSDDVKICNEVPMSSSFLRGRTIVHAAIEIAFFACLFLALFDSDIFFL